MRWSAAVIVALAFGIFGLSYWKASMTLLEASILTFAVALLGIVALLALKARSPRSVFEPRTERHTPPETLSHTQKSDHDGFMRAALALEDDRLDKLERLEQRLHQLEASHQQRFELLAREVSTMGQLLGHLAEALAEHEAIFLAQEHEAAIEKAQQLAQAEPEPAQPSQNSAKSIAPSAPKPSLKLDFSTLEQQLELYLQPIVTLPQRKVTAYEVLSRLRDAQGDLLLPDVFLPAAAKAGLSAKVDLLLLSRAVQVVSRLAQRGRSTLLFCNLATATLNDPAFFDTLKIIREAHKDAGTWLVFEISQADFMTFGPLERESLTALRDLGYVLSLDQVSQLNVDLRDMGSLGFQYLKVKGSLLLHGAEAAGASVHAADLSGLYQRYGMKLIADHLETEADVIELLDYQVALAQGNVFSVPKPVRTDILSAPDERASLPKATS